jgi:hypothetical protein
MLLLVNANIGRAPKCKGTSLRCQESFSPDFIVLAL